MARGTLRRTGSNSARAGADSAPPHAHPGSLPCYRAIHNYAADAGGGSDTFSVSDAWRRTLLGSVAAGALFLGYGRSARAACSTAGTTATCSGDLSSGVSAGLPFTELNVNNLTDADSDGVVIKPAPGGVGIRFVTTGPVTLNSDLGTGRSIVTTGTAVAGIYVQGSAVTINHSGDVDASAAQHAIVAHSPSGPVSVTTVGDLSARYNAIYAFSQTGPTTVDSTGDLTSTGRQAIRARSLGTGEVTVKSKGSITSLDDGIYAHSTTGTASVTSSGDIHTTGVNAEGIYAGAAGGSVVVISTGDIITGFGGTSSAGADGIDAASDAVTDSGIPTVVRVDSTGDITTTGNSAGGIKAYSRDATIDVIVNSKGDISTSGTTVSNARNQSGDAIFARAVSGGDVSVTSEGVLTTKNTRGIFAYAGNGAVAVKSTGDVTSSAGDAIYAHAATGSLVDVASTGTVSAAQWGITATNGGGATKITSKGNVSAGTGAAIYAFSRTAGVTVTSTGDLSSTGNVGIRARGLGAGGTTVESTGLLATLGDGIYAQSTLGMTSVTSKGDIHTKGNDAEGIYAGSGSRSVTVISTGDIVTSFGVSPGSGSDGIEAVANGTDSTATVTVQSTGNISTTANNASGIKAYSRSAAIGITVTSKGDISATGGTASNFRNQSGDAIFASAVTGGDVTVTSKGDLTTGNARGIFASTGSGAITVLSTGDVTSAGSSGIVALGSSAGDIEITSIGAIKTLSDGISASSQTGAITIDSTGDVTSTAGAAVASSFGTSSTVTLHGGDVRGATFGALFTGGGTNALANYGQLSGGTGALKGDGGDEKISNYGLITGNVDLGTGDNAFFNRMGATFRSGSIVNLGGANQLTNDGNLSPGGAGTIVTTALTGNLVQNGPGTFTVDINETASQKADLVTVSGSARFAGSVTANILNITSTSGMVMIASASAMASTATIADTDVYDFSLKVTDATQLWLVWQPLSVLTLIDRPLTPNEEATADYLDTLQQSNPGPDLRDLLDAVRGLPNEAAIIAALDRLHPEHYLAQVNDTLESSRLFVSDLMSCQANGDTRIVAADDQCLWAKVGGRTFNQDRTWTNIGGHTEAWNISAGAQVALQDALPDKLADTLADTLPDTWRLGFAGSYEQTSIRTNNSAHSSGERGEGGVVLKNSWGNTSLAAAAFAGYGWFDTTRSIALAGIATAKGEHEIGFGGVHARLAHKLGQQGGWYVQPTLDVDATYVSYGGFRETSGEAAALDVEGNEDWVLSASPAVELGSEWQVSKSAVVRPYVKVGFTFLNDSQMALSSSFLSAPSGVGTFTVFSEFDNILFDASAGVDVRIDSGASLKLSYDGRLSEESESHAGSVRIDVNF